MDNRDIVEKRVLKPNNQTIAPPPLLSPSCVSCRFTDRGTIP